MDEDAWIPPHRVLGIAEDADAAAIRKAYAVKLKTVRPDTDPVGFQKLVEARDHMLRWAGMPRVAFDNDDATEDVPRVVIADVPTPPVVATDTSAVVAPPIAIERTTVVAPAVDPAKVEVLTARASDDMEDDDVDAVVDSQDVLNLLDLGLDTDTRLDREHFETVLAHLPAGALRWAESDIIESLAAAARRFEREPYLDAVRDAYDIAFVRLADIFDWEARDRTIHQTLSSEDAHVFFVVLGRALRRHVPGYAGRYARPRPATAVATEAPQPWFSWRSAWRWAIILVIVSNLARCLQSGSW